MTAAQNEVVHSYHSVRGLHFLAVVSVAPILYSTSDEWTLDLYI